MAETVTLLTSGSGPGGDLGQDGSAALSGTAVGGIGTAGKAIDLNGFTVTYDITGDIMGTVY